MLYKKGYVSKIRTLKLDARPLIRFTLGHTNCLIASHSLTFLAEAEEGSLLVVFGDYNKRKQFVVKEFRVLSTSRLAADYQHSRYPKQKQVN